MIRITRAHSSIIADDSTANTRLNLTSMRCCILAVFAALALADAKFSRGKATMPTSHVAIKSHAEPGMSTIVTSTVKKDVFKPVPTDEPLVGSIVTKFMSTYRKEISHSSLEAEVAGVIKAESTEVRNEMQDKQVGTDGLGIDLVEESQSQQYRIFMLVKYKFDSSMLGRNRPYVTVMRLTMDCYNSMNAEPVDTAEDDEPALPPSTLACDVLEHTDLPRRNESTKSVPTYIQRQIFHSAPASYIHNHTLNVYYDAVEAQDLAFDALERAMADRDTMHYVRFRVQGGNAQDCVIAIEHTAGINTLRFQDAACYEDADSNALATASRMDLAKANAPLFVLIASIAGAFVAMLLVWRQRRKQRSGYSYLHSNTSKLSHIRGATGTTNTDAAMAC